VALAGARKCVQVSTFHLRLRTRLGRLACGLVHARASAFSVHNAVLVASALAQAHFWACVSAVSVFERAHCKSGGVRAYAGLFVGLLMRVPVC
jgi:hypothetical protein